MLRKLKPELRKPLMSALISTMFMRIGMEDITDCFYDQKVLYTSEKCHRDNRTKEAIIVRHHFMGTSGKCSILERKATTVVSVRQHFILFDHHWKLKRNPELTHWSRVCKIQSACFIAIRCSWREIFRRIGRIG